MFPIHYHLKILNDERHRELLAQSRMVKQLAEHDRQRTKPGFNWSLSRIIRNLLKYFAQPKLVIQPNISSPECQIQPNCQEC
jgi:hypothetical protein